MGRSYDMIRLNSKQTATSDSAQRAERFQPGNA
jgi:hypothetical protein